MIDPTPLPNVPLPSDVEIILAEEPAPGGYMMTTQPFRLENGVLTPCGPATTSYRAVSDRDREERINRGDGGQ